MLAVLKNDRLNDDDIVIFLYFIIILIDAKPNYVSFNFYYFDAIC